jgi:uncharacterized protein
MYFDKPGIENTEATLRAVAKRAGELGIDELVVATTTGGTAEKAHEICTGMKVIGVGYHAGFKEPFQLRITPETRQRLEAKGVPVICATHALSGIERGLSKKLPGHYPALLVSEVLRLFGQGTKVAVEVAIMAADSGLLSGKPIMALGGSGKGCDTALVLTPADMSRVLEMKIHEIVCKPSLFD